MNRLLFQKTGNAVWISHLDLMRLFQRAFKRGGLNLKHTQGFSPRAIVSIALPMSVGVESVCEILDYELEGQEFPCDEIVRRLNETLPAGIRVIRAYDSDRKIKYIAYLDCLLTLEYDNGVPAGTADKILTLFQNESLTVEKRGKNGPVEQNIIPMIRKLDVTGEDAGLISIQTRICAQNPSLNPALLIAAIEHYLPEIKPDFAKIRRIEVFEEDGKVFR